MNVRLHLNPWKLLAVLIGIALVLAAIDLVSQAPRYYPFTFPEWRRVDRVFHMGREANVPTWYSAILMFLAGFLLALIAAAKRQGKDRFRWHWLLLSLIFIYLSADEAAVLHEELGSLLGTYIPNRFLRFGGWIGFAVIGMLLFAAVFLPFWAQLEGLTKWLFALAGVLFVGGAMGVESLSIPYEMGRAPSYRWAVQTAIEETLEMAGVAVFVAALVDYIQRWHPLVELGPSRGGLARQADSGRNSNSGVA